MKKLFLALIALTFTFTTVNAQSNTTLSLGAELSLPVGTFGDIYSFGIGASGQANFGTTSHFEGILLSQTAIILRTGASVNGRLLAQTAVNLDQNAIVQP